MDDRDPGLLTELLQRWSAGDVDARDEVMALVSGELKRCAARALARERRGHTFSPTALVNEAYLRLAKQGTPWRNRNQFLALAAKLMRRILIDYARARAAGRRPDPGLRVTLDDNARVLGAPDVDLIALSDCLDGLAALDPTQAELVELRFFSGLSIEETAATLKVSPVTVKREWNSAKAWLHRCLAAKAP